MKYIDDYQRQNYQNRDYKGRHWDFDDYPKDKRSFFCWKNLLITLSVFVFAFINILVIFGHSYSMSYCAVVYNIPLAAIVTTINEDFDVLSFALQIALIITGLSILFIKLINYYLSSVNKLIFIFIILFSIIPIQIVGSMLISSFYIQPLTASNLHNPGEKYVYRTETTYRQVEHSRRGRGGHTYIHFNIEGYDAHIRINKIVYLDSHSITLVMRNGSRGLPFIEDYAIDKYTSFYNIPTKEELYAKNKQSGKKDKTKQRGKPSEFGGYFKKHMPKVGEKTKGMVGASCYVTKNGDIKNVRITNHISYATDNALMKALKDMGKWNGEPINDNVYINIDIYYLRGEPHVIFADLQKEDSSYLYIDCYEINKNGAFYTDRIKNLYQIKHI